MTSWTPPKEVACIPAPEENQHIISTSTRALAALKRFVYVIQDLTKLWDFKASTTLESKVFSLERLCPSSLLVPSLLVYSPWSLVSSL